MDTYIEKLNKQTILNVNYLLKSHFAIDDNNKLQKKYNKSLYIINKDYELIRFKEHNSLFDKNINKKIFYNAVLIPNDDTDKIKEVQDKLDILKEMEEAHRKKEKLVLELFLTGLLKDEKKRELNI